jgi:hypothetical protein
VTAVARGRPGAIIGLMPQPPGGNPELERAIVGALRDQIKAHGPITPEWIGSAAKRILGQLANAKPTGLARALGKRRVQLMGPEAHAALSSAGGTGRWKGVSAKKHAAITSAGGKKAWADMTPDQRSAEMKRRAQVRAEKRKAP